MERPGDLGHIVAGLERACGELGRAFGGGFVGLALFGSWARGEAREDSDVDVLLVLRGLGGLEVRVSAYRVLAEHVGRAVTLVDVRLEELGRPITPLMLNIAADAVVICDEAGEVSKALERVRRFIEEAGLVRYRTPDGKYGWRRADGRPLAEALRRCTTR